MSRIGQIALLTAGAVATGVVGYCVYFDYMRRNSPDFRKGLRKQQKKIKEAAAAAAKDQAVRDQRELTMALVELELEAPPSTPEAMEAYFQEHVATAEALAAQGPAHYVKAATHFYRALRVYPQPVELLMIYQKVCPEPVFQLVIKLTQLTSAAVAAGAPPVARASVADIDDIDANPEAAEPKAAQSVNIAETVAEAEEKIEAAEAVDAAVAEAELAAKIEAVIEAAANEFEAAAEELEAKEAAAPAAAVEAVEEAAEEAAEEPAAVEAAEVASQESNNGSGASWDHVEPATN